MYIYYFFLKLNIKEQIVHKSGKYVYIFLKALLKKSFNLSVNYKKRREIIINPDKAK